MSDNIPDQFHRGAEFGAHFMVKSLLKMRLETTGTEEAMAGFDLALQYMRIAEDELSKLLAAQERP